jgi:hypothetical protein
MKYEQATGRLLEDDGKVIGLGWAGHLQGRNNPEMQIVKGVGPLPKGKYIVENPENGTHLGPLAFPLTPDPTNKMFGRDAFFIHGASAEHPALSSDGCIIQGRIAREYISIKIGAAPADSPLRKLEVV